MIPTAMLPHRCTVRAFTGLAGNGTPTHAPPMVQPKRARIIGKGVQIRTADGTVTLTSDAAQIRPGHTIPPQSLFADANGRVWEVLEQQHQFEGPRPWCDLLLLDGPRPLAGPSFVTPPEPEP